MDHNEFDFIEDLVHPFYNFLEQLNIGFNVDEEDPKEGQLNFPEELFLPPSNHKDITANGQNMTVWNWFLMKFMDKN